MPVLAVQHAVRMGDDGGFMAAATADVLGVELVSVSAFVCGPDDPKPFATVAAERTVMSPWFRYGIPGSEAVYVRIQDGARYSRWIYVAPATAAPASPDVTAAIDAGRVTLSVTGSTDWFALEEDITGQWRHYGYFQTSTSRGPYPPQKTARYRLWAANIFGGNWVYSASPATIAIELP
jgi:hypothetical protein